MRITLLASALAAACCAAHGADSVPTPQPLAPGGVIAAAKARAQPVTAVVTSPVLMSTTATRSADGRIGLVCEQKSNPRAQPSINQPALERKP